MRKAKVIPIRTKGSIDVTMRLMKAEIKHLRKRARDALFKYADHLPDCPANKNFLTKCDCGLFQVINEFHED